MNFKVLDLRQGIRTYPARNRLNFQILAYLLTIDLLYATIVLLIILTLLTHPTTRQQ